MKGRGVIESLAYVYAVRAATIKLDYYFGRTRFVRGVDFLLTRGRVSSHTVSNKWIHIYVYRVAYATRWNWGCVQVVYIVSNDSRSDSFRGSVNYCLGMGVNWEIWAALWQVTFHCTRGPTDSNAESFSLFAHTKSTMTRFTMLHIVRDWQVVIQFDLAYNVKPTTLTYCHTGGKFRFSFSSKVGEIACLWVEFLSLKSLTFLWVIFSF